MISEFGVNQFKFDGTGNANKVSPGSQFDSDFDAAIHLIGDLRQARPDLYVNLTTGTYPSPFWLRYADSIWRGGEDHSFAGVGARRQKWITYRDADTFRHVVSAGPLYPINSLMLHGMIYAKQAKNLGDDPAGDFRREVRDYFGTGTQLQEMYISPDLLSAKIGTILRRRPAGRTATRRPWWTTTGSAATRPSWSPTAGRRGRRPRGFSRCATPATSRKHSPSMCRRRWNCRRARRNAIAPPAPWKSDTGREPVTLQAGTPHEFPMAPFEVITLELK